MFFACFSARLRALSHCSCASDGACLSWHSLMILTLVSRPPKPHEVRDLQAAIARRHHLLVDVYAVADGVKLNIQCPSTSEKNSIFYNGWTHGHYVGNVLVFAPSGVIVACAVNAPGCLHDSLIAEWGGVYTALLKVYEETGGRVVVDAAFGAAEHPYLIKSGRLGAVGIQATSLRQAAKWGMRGLRSGFPRLNATLPYEERGERLVILNCIILLYNFRTRLVGYNQIRSTYYSGLIRRDAEMLLRQ